MLCMQWWLGTTAVPCQIDTISTPEEKTRTLSRTMELGRPWPDEQKKGSAFRVNVLIDGVRLACSMHRTFFSEASYNETKNNYF